MPRAQAKELKRALAESAVGQVAGKQQKIQRVQDRQDRKELKKNGGQTPEKRPMQAGVYDYPSAPLRAQHLPKPGMEADLELKPQFMAPAYRGSGKLQGMAALRAARGHALPAALGRCQKLEVLRQGRQKNRRSLRQARFNNAAFQTHAGSIKDLNDERIDETLRTNIYGYMFMARAVVPHLSQGSSIINTGSVTGLEGSSKLLNYSATKGAIHAFTKALASNLLDKGIRVNAVAPGPVWTPLNPADSPAERVREFGSGSDMKRPAQPEAVTGLCVSGLACVCELHHGHRVAGDGQCWGLRGQFSSNSCLNRP